MEGKESKQRLSILLPSLRGGGAERTMLNLAQGFAQRGHGMDFVLQRAEGSYLSQVPPSVRVVELGARRMARALFPLVSYLRRERPQSLLSGMMHSNIIALLARKLARVDMRIVITEHSPPSIASRDAKNLRGRYLLAAAKRIYPWADGIVAVSKGVAHDLATTLNLPRERIQVVYSPVVNSELLQKAKEEVDHPWLQSDQPPVVLGVGRLTPAKDFPTLLRAFALIRKEHEAHLLILGEGEERGGLEKLAQKLGIAQDVSLPGFVSNPYSYMARAAVLALASKREGLPTVLIEALACGTPVVSTDCPSGPAEILENGKYGPLVAVGDYEALAKRIVSTLANPISGSVLQERAHDFSVEKIADRYEALLLGD